MKAGNNKGYSLVELLLAIFILALVMAGVVSIMRATSVSYRNGNFEVNVQTEAQIVANQIEELLVDADTSVSYNSSTGVYTIVNHGVSHQLKYDSSESTIQYQSGSGGWSLMAEYVEGFSIDGISTNTSEVACDNKVTVNVTMNNQGYKYTAVKDVYYRNAIENTKVQQLDGTGSGMSSSTSEEVIYVNVRRYDIIDLKKDYNFDTSYINASSELTNRYEFINVAYNNDTSNTHLSKAIEPSSITYPATPGTTTGFLRTSTWLNNLDNWDEGIAKDNTEYYIKGKLLDDPKTTSINEAVNVKLVFYTEKVTYKLKTDSGSPNASGYCILLTPTSPGDDEKYVAYVQPTGVDLGMMLNTTDYKIRFGVVAYSDDGDCVYEGNAEKWSKDPQFHTIKEVGMDAAPSLGRVAEGSNWWLNIKVAVDEESGALVIHQTEKMSDSSPSAYSGDFTGGNKRLAVILYIDDGTGNDAFKTRSCDVVDFNLCLQGVSFDSYKGGNTYTDTMGNASTWKRTAYPTADNF